MSLKFCMLDADYIIEKRAEVRLMGVDEKGRSVMVIDDSFEPYFYVLPRKKEALMRILCRIRMVTRVESVRRKIGLEEKEFIKVFVDLPQSMTKVRDIIKHRPEVEECYEYTHTFYKRYLMDKNFQPFDWLDVVGNDIQLTQEKNGYQYYRVIRASKISKSEKKSSLIPNLKVMAFDTEVIDSQVIMISVVDNRGFRKVLTYKKTKGAEVLKDEKSMIERFVKIVEERDPDVIIGFMSDQFDFEILRERADALKVDLKLNRDGSSIRAVRRAKISATRINGRIHIDLFNWVQNILAPQLQAETLSLNDVSEELLGKGKLEISFEEINAAWKSGKIDNVIKYCQNDSVLTLELAEIMLPQIIELSRVSGQIPFDCSRMTYGLLVESFLLRRAAEQGIIAPNTPHWAEIERRRLLGPYKGGYVMEPKVGLHDNIAVFDFRSLYPSIIATYNISPETLDVVGCKNAGASPRQTARSELSCKNVWKVPGLRHSFCKSPPGFVSSQIKYLIERRRELKKRMKGLKEDSVEWKRMNEEQNALKTIANATYGLFAYPGARWYSRECAECAAAFGRDSIKKTINEAKKFGFDVIYADTDSLFVKMIDKNNIARSKVLRKLSKRSFDNIKKKAEIFFEKINKSLPGMLELELQGVYTRGLFVPAKLGGYTAKKRYALIDRNGNITVRGFEAVRRDWCDLAKNLQHDVLRLVLKGKEREAVKKVHEAVRRIKNRKVSLEDITMRTMLRKSLEEYKTTGPHIAVAHILRKEGHEIHPGVVLSYIITKRKGSISEKAQPTDRVKIDDYDVEYYLNNQVLAVVMRVLEFLGYKEEEFLE